MGIITMIINNGTQTVRITIDTDKAPFANVNAEFEPGIKYSDELYARLQSVANAVERLRDMHQPA